LRGGAEVAGGVPGRHGQYAIQPFARPRVDLDHPPSVAGLMGQHRPGGTSNEAQMGKLHLLRAGILALTENEADWERASSV